MAKSVEMVQLEMILRKISAANPGTGSVRFWFRITPSNVDAAVFYGQFYGFHVSTEFMEDELLLFTFDSDERMINEE
jgi:hypothetical protein